MLIKTISLTNFRNHDTYKLNCKPTTTLILGANGCGKTSVLEAIYILTQGKSFRATDPDILLLDEPFSALDYQTRLMVSDDIYQILKKEKKEAILVTHDISEAISMADEISVLTKRPATVKNNYKIKLTVEGEKTPLKSRKAPEFKD